VTSKAARAAAGNVYPVPPGLSLLEMMEEDLDEAYDTLMSDLPAMRPGTAERAEMTGYARGLLRAIATVREPYDVDSGEVRARVAAVNRYNERSGPS